MSDHYPFSIPPLPYPYNALEPYLDEKTVRIHHDKHFQGYADKLNQILEPYPEYQDWSLKALLVYADSFPEKIRTDLKNNAGGVYNHTLYFDNMAPNAQQQPSGRLAAAIDRDFGSFENWKAQMKNAAMGQFASGWAWLVYDIRCKLEILTTPNHGTPPLSIRTPLLVTDVWEHAYYLKYQNRRDEYLENWFRLIDWKKAEESYPCG